MTSPIGTILAYGGLVDGNARGELQRQGWLICDGGEYLEEEYQELENTIGAIYGNSRPGSFKVPDLRGRFLRGVDHGAGRDPDANRREASAAGGNTGDKVGSGQDDRMQAHKHYDSGHTHPVPSHFCGLDLDEDSDGNNNGLEFTNWHKMPEKIPYEKREGKAQIGEPGQSSAGYVRYGQETRPTNIYVNWIIKAKDV